MGYVRLFTRLFFRAFVRVFRTNSSRLLSIRQKCAKCVYTNGKIARSDVFIVFSDNDICLYSSVIIPEIIERQAFI